MTNQRLYKFRCLLYIKHDTHKLLTIFNVSSNLISLLSAACEGTTVRYTIEDAHNMVLYKDVLSIGARSLFDF